VDGLGVSPDQPLCLPAFSLTVMAFLPPSVMSDASKKSNGPKTVASLAALEDILAPIFAKTPHLPKEARDFLVSIAPWLALIFGILGVGAILSAGSLFSIFAPFGAWHGMGLMNLSITISMVASLVASVVNMMAYKPLSEGKKRGWNLLFYGTVFTTAATLLGILFNNYYSSPGNLIGVLIGFWLLFEIRSHYKS
jgi:uncharacterized BrkB/YihY/UPF0761 family membrane protein